MAHFFVLSIGLSPALEELDALKCSVRMPSIGESHLADWTFSNPDVIVVFGRPALTKWRS